MDLEHCCLIVLLAVSSTGVLSLILSMQGCNLPILHNSRKSSCTWPLWNRPLSFASVADVATQSLHHSVPWACCCAVDHWRRNSLQSCFMHYLWSGMLHHGEVWGPCCWPDVSNLHQDGLQAFGVVSMPIIGCVGSPLFCVECIESSIHKKEGSTQCIA